MVFGIKTSWLAVRDRSPQQVAGVLDLVDPEPLSWDEGVDRAYAQGIYVSGPISDWTLATGRHHLMPLPYGATDPGFVGWLAVLSERLGEVQFFANERGWSYHKGWQSFAEQDWDAYFKTTPGEHDVLKIAGRWSVDPNEVDSTSIGAGIFGVPAWADDNGG